MYQNKPKFELIQISGWLTGSFLGQREYEIWQISNLLHSFREAQENPLFFAGDIVNLDDERLVIFMLPQGTDEILALMLMLGLEPDDLQNWLDGMLADLPESEYNESNALNTSDSEVQSDESTTEIPITQVPELPDTVQKAKPTGYTNNNPMADTGD